ncbi:hypothetical protein AB0M02_00390 [Actinoplanes sp. NPDC051861]|uniref:hypothetical protein n=1 Tax=Actinoplanes sp. NPDC051861 TaxID=3155170 RepID=UPI0034391402
MRYFKIYTPDPTYTGRIGSVSFADGEARVSFDDTRNADGICLADEHQVQVGRSAVLFARRRGYRLVETDEAGKPLPDESDEQPKRPAFEPLPGSPSRAASKADWVTFATDGAPEGLRLSKEQAEALIRDQLAEKYLGPKED